jgi:hypothetical protein
MLRLSLSLFLPGQDRAGVVIEDPAKNFELPQTPSLSDGLSHVLLLLTVKKGRIIFRRQTS